MSARYLHIRRYFGELCLAGLGPRMETATAMEETVFRRIPCAELFVLLTRAPHLAEYFKPLAIAMRDGPEAGLTHIDAVLEHGGVPSPAMRRARCASFFFTRTRREQRNRLTIATSECIHAMG